MCSVALPAWCWAQSVSGPTSGPKVPFLHASYATQLSLRDSVKCRRLIESPWYQNHWGHRFKLVGDQNTKSRFGNDKGGERLITSITAAVTGEGFSVGIVDDANAAQEAFSEANIQAVIDWWDSTFSTRANDPKTSAWVTIQQRLAENDLSGHILSKDEDGVVHLCLPMRYEADRSFMTPIGWKDPRVVEGELLWPERFDEASVKSLEGALGPFGFAGQMQQRPEPKGGGIIKREWWIDWPEPKFPPMDFILASLDTAYTEKEENDFSAMTVWGVFTSDARAVATRSINEEGRPVYIDRAYDEHAPNVMLMYGWMERLALHDLVKKVGETCKKMKVDQLLIENKAAGISVAQEMRRLFSNETFGVVLDDPKSIDKVSRLYSVQHLFAEKMIYAPSTKWAEAVISQIASFPHGKHDDAVDTCSAALRKLRTMGMLVRAPERMADIEGAKRYVGQSSSQPLYPS